MQDSWKILSKILSRIFPVGASKIKLDPAVSKIMPIIHTCTSLYASAGNTLETDICGTESKTQVATFGVILGS